MRRRFFPLQLTQQLPSQSISLSARLQPVSAETDLPPAPAPSVPVPGACSISGATWIFPPNVQDFIDAETPSWAPPDPWYLWDNMQLHRVGEAYIVEFLNFAEKSVFVGEPLPWAERDGFYGTFPTKDFQCVYARWQWNELPALALMFTTGGAHWRFRWQSPAPGNPMTSLGANATVVPYGEAAFGVYRERRYRDSDFVDGWLIDYPQASAVPYDPDKVPLLYPTGVDPASYDTDPDAFTILDRLVATAYCGDVPFTSIVLDIVNAGW